MLRERTDLSRLNAIHAGLDDPLVSLTVNRPTSTQPPTLQPPTAPRLDLPRNISDEALDLRLRSSASVTTDARSLPDPAGSAFTAAPSGSSKYAKMKGAELVALLDDRKLRNWDKKADMIERLEKYDRDNAGSAPAPSLQLVQIADADGGRTDEEYDSGDDDYEPDAQEELQLSVIDVMASGAVYGPGEDPVRREVQQEVLEAARNYGISQHTAVLASAGLMGTAEEFNHRVSRINIHTPCRNPQLVSTYLTNHSDSRDSPTLFERACHYEIIGCRYRTCSTECLIIHEKSSNEATVHRANAILDLPFSEPCAEASCTFVGRGRDLQEARRRLANHRRNRHNWKEMSCSIGGHADCDKKLGSKDQLKYHKQKHHRATPFIKQPCPARC